MRTPLPQTNLTEISLSSLTSSISFISFRLRALKLSCGFFRLSHPLFSMLCALFDKNTRVAYPLPIFTSHRSPVTGRALRRAPQAQKCPPVSPLPATFTHSLSRNPFVCHSYTNTRDRRCHAVSNFQSGSISRWQSNFARPLFSWSYKSLFPQLIYFHIHTKPPGGVGVLSNFQLKKRRRDRSQGCYRSLGWA
jgi:hypothetical protein